MESPSGAVSVLTVHPPAVGYFIFFSRTVLDGSYSFGSSKHLGESAAGEWKLRLRDEGIEDEGTLHSWKVTAYGHGSTPGFPEIISTTPGATSIDVGWLAPDDTGASAITEYDLRYVRFGAPPGSSWTVLEDVGASDSLSHELTGLSGGVRYHLQVRAVSDSGPGPWSETLAGDTTPVTPEAPTITDVSSAVFELGLSWDHPNVGTAGLLRYDARHIRSDATDKADANWTALQGIWNIGDGEPRATVANLLNGVEYDVQVRAVNTAATGPWSSTRTGTPEAVNSDPEFDEMGTVVRRIRENGSADEDVGPPILATDPNGDVLDYNLKMHHNDFYIVRETGQLRTRRPLDHEYGGFYFLQVDVRDYADVYGLFDDSVDDIARVRVEVEDVNETPTVVGPSHVLIEENSKVYVGRYAASDPEGESTTWSLAGPDKDHFQITVNGDLALTALPDFEARADGNNRYEVVVGASDGELTGTRDVTVVITDVDETPTVVGPSHVLIAENSQVYVGRYAASDPEGESTTWSLAGPDKDHFQITVNGDLALNDLVPVEARADGNNRYEVVVGASDGELTGTRDVTVVITDVDETPTVVGPSHVLIAENSQVYVGRYAASDPEGESTTWSLAGPDKDHFQITVNGDLALTALPDFEARADGNNRYEVVVGASDGELTGTRDVTVVITDVDETPTVVGPSHVLIAENSQVYVGRYAASDPEGESTTWSLAGPDKDHFQITVNGDLALTALPDFEARADGNNRYEVVVGASDGELTGTRDVTVVSPTWTRPRPSPASEPSMLQRTTPGRWAPTPPPTRNSAPSSSRSRVQTQRTSASAAASSALRPSPTSKLPTTPIPTTSTKSPSRPPTLPTPRRFR